MTADSFDNKKSIQKADTPRLALSVSEVASRLGIGRTSVYAAIRDRKLVSVKLGGRRLFPICEVEKFLGGTPMSAK